MKTAPHNSKQSFITIPAGPNERQRARKLKKWRGAGIGLTGEIVEVKDNS